MRYTVTVTIKGDPIPKVFFDAVDTFKHKKKFYITFGQQGKYESFELHMIQKITETF